MPGSRNWVEIEVLFTITHGDNFLLPIPGTLSSAGLKDRKLSRTLLKLHHQIGNAEIVSWLKNYWILGHSFEKSIVGTMRNTACKSFK